MIKVLLVPVAFENRVLSTNHLFPLLLLLFLLFLLCPASFSPPFLLVLNYIVLLLWQLFNRSSTTRQQPFDSFFFIHSFTFAPITAALLWQWPRKSESFTRVNGSFNCSGDYVIYYKIKDLGLTKNVFWECFSWLILRIYVEHEKVPRWCGRLRSAILIKCFLMVCISQV